MKEIGTDYPYRATLQCFLDTLKLPFPYYDLTQPNNLIDLYTSTDPFAFAMRLVSVLTLIHYVVSEITKNYSQVDKSWSILPVVYAWHFTLHHYFNHGYFHPRLLLATILITLWGSRLTYNFARKGGYRWSGQDYRYPYLLEKLGKTKFALLNLTLIAPFQDFLLLFMVSPLYIIYQFDAFTLTMSDIVVTIVFLGFLLLETVADEQQYVFQTEKHALLNHVESKNQLKGDYKLGFLWHSGIFQYSRHANFFAEQCMWWTIYLFSLVATTQYEGKSFLTVQHWMNWSIVGPFVLTLLFQGSTWLTEVIINENHCIFTWSTLKQNFFLFPVCNFLILNDNRKFLPRNIQNTRPTVRL
ncbi:hypothetical protein BDF20DRAFT_852438 [Mycotypha africana]|uniref:uncharacterized protein n=1 Tax=Mycotypha africana TaxID=64632 RepID=UPI002301A218|nr:uncharacterized protein BDF20DRAFT_852438 [Mycotypha africana]KAI8987830.1 hypothetical protein BDF20DRAFT_852438 [Mycotypha africana]